MNDRRITNLLLVAVLATSLILLTGCSKKKKRRKARSSSTESTAVVASNEPSPDKSNTPTEKPMMEPQPAIGAVVPSPEKNHEEKQDPHNENALALGDEAESPAVKTVPSSEDTSGKHAPAVPENDAMDENEESLAGAPTPEEDPSDPVDGDTSDSLAPDTIVPNENEADPELVPNEDEPVVVTEGSHEVFNTSGDLKAPWLALKAGPAPGDQYKILAEMPDGTQVNVVEMGFGKRGQWWYVRVQSGPHKGTQGYAHSKWIRER